MRLPLTEVRVVPDLQLRGGLDMDRVKAMNEFEEQGGNLPPIIVVGDDNLLADGHHRLEAAERIGRVDIEANRIEGDLPDAVALAIRHNDLATSLPLTRTQRNQGIKLLLEAGWTLRRIAKAAGVHNTTVLNIQRAATLKDKLPAAVSAKLRDTVALRIAEIVPAEQQEEFATAVAAVPNKADPTRSGLMESRVREAAKAVRAGASPTEAVADHTPAGDPAKPRNLSEVTTQAYRRLDRFLGDPMTIEGVDRDYWEVLDVLVANRDHIVDPALGSLASRLAEVSARTGAYAEALRERAKVSA